LREETRLEIHSVRDSLNKLSASVSKRVSGHINSTKDQNDSLRKDINIELNFGKARSKYIYARCKQK